MTHNVDMRSGIRRLNGHFRRALILEQPDPSLDDFLREQGIEPERLDDGVDGEAVVRLLEERQHDLLFKRSSFPVDSEVLNASQKLPAVMLCCIGDDSVDSAACAEAGVLVMNDPISNGRSVAEMVFGEMILLARRIVVSHEAGRKHLWTKDNLRRYELQGKALSVIGLGNIGKQVAQMAEACGMDV